MAEKITEIKGQGNGFCYCYRTWRNVSASWRKWEWGGIYDLSGCDALATELRTVEEDACERSIFESLAITHGFRRLISFMSFEDLLDMKSICSGINPGLRNFLQSRRCRF